MMNPIFSRRYKGGSRPNIMPTAAKRQSYMKSMSPTTGNNSGGSTSSSMSSGSSASALSTFSMGDSAEEISPGGDTRSPEREDNPQLFTKSSSKNSKTGYHQTATSPGESASRLLAQQLLQSKQNMLAQSSLTPYENRERAKLGGKGSKGGTRSGGGGGGHQEERHKLVKTSLMRHSFSTESFAQSLASSESTGYTNGIPRSPTVHGIGGAGDMTLCDLEDDEEFQETEYTSRSSTASSYNYAPVAVANSRISRPNLNQRISKESLDMKTWRELKQVVLGNGNFLDGWIGQGFVFDTKIPFGLVQKKGGPCGVLAVVQSLVIRNLLFGSPFSVASPKERKNRLEEISAFLCSGGDEEGMDVDGGGVAEIIRKERANCLVDAIAEILWTCGEYQQHENGYSGNKLKQQERSSLIMFSDFRIQPEVICVKGHLELQHFLQNSIHRFDCIALVYSAVLTRGISGVKDDLDFENCSLIGQHGYCSQELINLLAIGRAISNTFDNEIELDGKILKGIPERCDIGLLSLFEHYDSIKVGNFLKSPRFPIWMICSESHFSVMFSSEIDLCSGDEVNTDNNDNFDLFYYDGLSRQEKMIRLSIRLSAAGNNGTKPASLSSSSTSGRYHSYNTLSPHDNPFSTFSSGNSSSNPNKDEDLIPPLEKCIRTKWPGAQVDWNDTEPIL